VSTALHVPFGDATVNFNFRCFPQGRALPRFGGNSVVVAFAHRAASTVSTAWFFDADAAVSWAETMFGPMDVSRMGADLSLLDRAKLHARILALIASVRT
jgi:hypothetical protein